MTVRRECTKALSSCVAVGGQDALNQTTKDWHSRSVTLSPSATLRINSAKGLAVKPVLSVVEGFFAALRMTLLNDCIAECTEVMCFDLAVCTCTACGSRQFCSASCWRRV